MRYRVGLNTGISVEWDQVDIVGNGRWIHCYNYGENGFSTGEEFYYPEATIRYFMRGEDE